MGNQLGSIDIDCDAPCYAVVQAGERLGFQSPLDVRWCRLNHYLEGRRESGGGFHPWRWLFGGGLFRKTTCSCGKPVPVLEPYTFTFASKEECFYLLGQCCRCRTMFWEEATVPSRAETEWACWGI
jgi:hypothetical protein